MKHAMLAMLAIACSDPTPRATAYRIGSLQDAIGGPHAIGTIGDFMLENDQIRIVIADTGVSADPTKTTYGRVNTTFGGSMVDADIQRPGGRNGNGNDQLAELLPGFLFTVINPTSVKVTKDGSEREGGPAEVTVTGTGGDLFQMVALLNTGLMMPSNLELAATYRLYPKKRYVEIEVTIKNKTTGAHPFPYLNPTQIADLLGRNVPGIENLQLSVPMGMLPLFGGEQDIFTPGFAGFNVQYAIEDAYKIAGGFPGFPGMVADFVATKGEGVSYGMTIPASPANYVNKYKARYPMQDITPYSVLLPFTYAGVAGVYMYDPPAQLAPQEQFSFTSYFIVGDGDVASVVDAIHDLRNTATGTFGGKVVDELSQAPVANADVMILDAGGRPVNQIRTDAGGNFVARLAAGTYGYTVIKGDRLPTTTASFSITAGKQSGALIQMKTPATIAIDVRDEKGRHAPAKIQLIGRFDAANQGKDPRDFLYSLELGEHRRPTAFDGGNRFIENAWWTKDGRVQAQVRPGTYELVVTRGPEYELTTKQLELRAGQFVSEALTLVPAWQDREGDGWIAGDFHIHALPSTDSGLPIVDRVISCAAEGLDVAVATDHNYITDYAPAIASSGLDPWLLGIPGMELTTFEMGHFNGYPLKIDPGSTRGGEFVWAGQPPAKLFEQLRALSIDRATSIVQVNHPRQQVLGYFAQFFIDPATADPYVPPGIMGVFAPYGDEFQAKNFSTDFDAIELLTGHRLEDIHNFRAPNPLPPGPFPNPQPVPGEVVVDAAGIPKFPGTVETWMTMLDRGHRATGMGVSDSHHLLGKEPGYGRTLLYVGKDKDTVGGFTRDDVIGAIRSHRAITTNAPFIEMHAGDKIIGDTVTGNMVDVRVRVRSPSWAPVDKLIVYSNSAVLVTRDIPAAQGTDFETIVQVRPTQDAWVVAEATGTANMFPVVSPTEFPPLDATVIISALSIGLDLSTLPLASNLKPARTHTTTPYAITNPIWIDANGDGTWTPPKPPFAKATAASGPRPDVRAQFEAVP